MSSIIPVVLIILLAMLTKDEDGHTDIGMLILYLLAFAGIAIIFGPIMESFFR